jgi:hypothetical protein
MLHNARKWKFIGVNRKNMDVVREGHPYEERGKAGNFSEISAL